MRIKTFFRPAATLLITVFLCLSMTDSVKGEVNINITGGANMVNSEEPNAALPVSSVPDVIPDGTISEGVFIDDVDLSGLSYEEATVAVEQYVEKLKTTEITITSISENRIVTAGDMGLNWTNQGVVAEAVGLGKEGNLINRYKALKDLEHENKIYSLELGFDSAAVEALVTACGEEDNVEAIDATLSKDSNGFTVVPGQTGHIVNVAASVSTIINRLENEWNKEPTTVALVVDIDEPKGKTEELERVKDVLGTYTTSFSSSGKARSENVRNGTRLIDGRVLYPGEEFSAYDAVNPFTEENGYYMAGSYLNGLVVESLGGGICQVSSTLYNAVLRAELEVTERFNHSMIVSYVKLSSDAAISGTSKDLKFVNNLEYPIYIEGYTTDDKKVTFNIYGIETRPSNRSISFESEELSRTEPEADRIIADAAQPVGYIDVQSAHIGYVGKLWKVVTVDGTETERTAINKSTYTMAPRTATVGTATSDPNIAAAIQAAIATNSIDYCKGIISSLNSAAAAAAAAATAPPPQ
ncbi:MAG: hypothetical protein GX633_04110 [Clostridiales bacterium]|nr:hypothetical protein [Clostridiales bacterium]